MIWCRATLTVSHTVYATTDNYDSNQQHRTTRTYTDQHSAKRHAFAIKHMKESYILRFSVSLCD